MFRFIINSEQYHRSLESTISQSNGEIVWPTADVNNMNIQIKCTVDEKNIKGPDKVKNWKEKCLSAVREVTNCLVVERSRNVAVEVPILICKNNDSNAL